MCVCVCTGEGLLLPGCGGAASRQLSCPFRRPDPSPEQWENRRFAPSGRLSAKNQAEDAQSIPTTSPSRIARQNTNGYLRYSCKRRRGCSTLANGVAWVLSHVYDGFSNVDGMLITRIQILVLNVCVYWVHTLTWTKIGKHWHTMSLDDPYPTPPGIISTFNPPVWMKLQNNGCFGMECPRGVGFFFFFFF